MIITTEVNHDFGETVYLKTNTEQLPRIVYGYELLKTGIIYLLCQGVNASRHYDYEITAEKNILVKE